MTISDLFGWAAPHKEPETAAPQTDNPYLNARREWNERYGEYIARERAWRSIAFFMGAIALLAVFGIVWIGGQSKLIPYVVEVNKLGDAVAARRADVSSRPDARILRSQLAEFISNLRSVYLDAAAERNGIKKAYAQINHGGPAYGMLNDYMRQDKHNPFKRAEYESVDVEVQSVLPLTSDTWRVEWVETTRDRDGHETSKATWTATITITVQAPTDEKAILANPTGLYVQDLHWSKRL